MKFNLLFIFCIGVNVLFSQDDLFQKANEQYSEGNYKSAIQLYDSIAAEGNKSKELFFNLGNAYYKNQEIGLAILYFEKALKYAPNDKDIQHNLQFCNKLILDKEIDLKESPINQLLYQNEGINRYGAIASLIFICLFSLLIFHIIKPFDKRILFSSIIILFSVAIVFSALGYKQIHFLNFEKYAVIISSTTNIKTEPSEKSSTAFILHEGSKIEILTTDSSWTKVVFNSDKIGWINNNHIKTI